MNEIGDIGLFSKLIQWGWLAMATVIGFFLRSFHSDMKGFGYDIQKMRDDHAEHKLHVAQNYMTNARADRMEEKIDKIYDAVVKK